MITYKVTTKRVNSYLPPKGTSLVLRKVKEKKEDVVPWSRVNDLHAWLLCLLWFDRQEISNSSMINEAQTLSHTGFLTGQNAQTAQTLKSEHTSRELSLSSMFLYQYIFSSSQHKMKQTLCTKKISFGSPFLLASQTSWHQVQNSK